MILEGVKEGAKVDETEGRGAVIGFDGEEGGDGVFSEERGGGDLIVLEGVGEGGEVDDTIDFFGKGDGGMVLGEKSLMLMVRVDLGDDKIFDANGEGRPSRRGVYGNAGGNGECC